MTVRPARGRRVRFAAEDGASREAPDGVAGLRLKLEARHGGTVLVDLVDLQPRALALAFAAALQHQAGLGGPLGAAGSIRQDVRAYRRCFYCLRAQDPAIRWPSDLRAGHIDGFEAMRVGAGHTAIYRHATLSKPINALRVIARDGTSGLDAELHGRLAYVSARPLGRSRPPIPTARSSQGSSAMPPGSTSGPCCAGSAALSTREGTILTGAPCTTWTQSSATAVGPSPAIQPASRCIICGSIAACPSPP